VWRGGGTGVGVEEGDGVLEEAGVQGLWMWTINYKDWQPSHGTCQDRACHVYDVCLLTSHLNPPTILSCSHAAVFTHRGYLWAAADAEYADKLPLEVCYLRHAFGLGEHYNSTKKLLLGALADDDEDHEEEDADEAEELS